jgi:serine/threonine protein kinase
MKSSCGTLSFLAPEVFAGTSNAGPPLDVWAMGVILFALLCGRLPFEGPDLLGTKRPRDAVIQSRISKGQYKIEESLSPEAKDLVRRLLRVDPTVRSSVPEIFSHVWLRSPPGAVTFSVPKPPVSTATPVTPSPIEVKTIEIESVPSSDLFEKVSPPAAASILLSPGGIERQDSRNLIQRRMSDKGLGAERRGSGRGLERGGSERDWDKKDSERGFDSDYCRSKSKSSCGDSEVGHDLITCVPNLDHMSDEDIVSMDLDKITLPSPSYDDDAQHDLPTSNVVDLSNAGNDTVDEMIPLPPPSPSRSGRFSIMNSRENSFSSRYSEITAASKDGLDESEDKNSLHLTLSPRTPPPAASPFVLVPLRRKDVAAEVKHSPRRARSTIPGLEHEEIARYQSSNDCFDYDTNDESLSQHCDVKSKALAGPGSAGASRNTRQSWTDQVDSQKGQENQADKVLSPPGGVSSPRIGGSKFSSPSVCRNKLHIAGSLSLKSHTIGSPANTRHSTSPSPRERTNSRTSRLQDQDGKLSSSPKTSRFNSPSYTSSPDRSGLKGTPPAPSGRASTSYGRKVLRNHGGTGGGGHII